MAAKLTYEELEQRVRELEQADIDRRRVEKELRISKKLLSDVMDIVPAYICAKDLDGRFILVNKQLADFYCTTVKEMTGMLHADICEDKEELEAMLQADREVIHSGKPKFIFEETMEHPNGSVSVLDTYKIPFTAHEDLAVLIVASDVTERKKHEEERRKLEAQILQAQKLESVGRLAGGVAHDLNNLLSPIMGFAEMMLEDFDADDERRPFIQKIIQACTGARSIVHQLLAFSRKQTLQFSPLNLNEVLTRFEELLRRTIREDIAIRYRFAPEIPNVLGDSGQIEQVIVNLAVNAQDAMPEGGTLTFETFPVDPEARRMPGDFVGLYVSDTGCGMDAETCKLIFEPFFSTKGEQGTGLGLATVYGIVKQHGGDIEVASDADSGTTFKIYLPVSEETEVPAASVSPEPMDLDGSETILLVEDNDHVRELAHAVLARHGYTVLVAENGRKALTVFDAFDGPVHLLLTDVILPKMNGRDLYRQISGRNPDVKVLYMSGYTNDVIASQRVAGAGAGFLQKPFAVRSLATKVRKILDG